MPDPRSDDALRVAVQEELAWDALIDESQIGVEVHDGVVTVVGTVPSYSERLVVQDAVQAVDGVHDVVNDVDVKPEPGSHPSDAELTEMLGQVLAWDALVPEQRISLSVSDGWVVLGGDVDIAVQRREAERAVAHVAGVRGVTNAIELADAAVTPDEVHDAITDALTRRAAHLASHIDVAIDGRVVTLSGRAQSALEKRAILGAVSHAPGIVMVCDELRVLPEAPTEP